jgi:hypothetical protein
MQSIKGRRGKLKRWRAVLSRSSVTRVSVINLKKSKKCEVKIHSHGLKLGPMNINTNHKEHKRENASANEDGTKPNGDLIVLGESL